MNIKPISLVLDNTQQILIYVLKLEYKTIIYIQNITTYTCDFFMKIIEEK